MGYSACFLCTVHSRTCEVEPVPHHSSEAQMRDSAIHRELLSSHCDEYQRRNGAGATYTGWIALLHPELVTLDPRLKTEGCQHKLIWDTTKQSRCIGSSCKSVAGRESGPEHYQFG